MYEYKGLVTRVVDGDTVDVSIDLGFKIYFKQRFRLLGIDAPELRRGNEESKMRGREATEWLKNRILNKAVLIQTEKDRTGKYGRYLCRIIFEDVNINDEMVKLGHAVVYG
jgi:micrococcal nuclease